MGQIADLSGNNRHGTATGTARPTVLTEAVNGLDVLAFDGVDNVIDLPPFPQQYGHELIAVVEPLTLGSGYRGFLERSVGNFGALGPAFLLRMNDGATAGIYWGGSPHYFDAVYTTTGRQLVRWSIRDGGDARGMTVDLNLNTATHRNTATAQLTEWISIGGGPGQRSAFRLCESMLLKPGAMPEFRDALAGHLLHKWGLQAKASSSFVYSAYPPKVIEGWAMMTTGERADRVMIRNHDTRQNITTGKVAANGHWTAAAPQGVRFDVSYFAPGCAPVIHGPYEMEPD